MNTADWNKLASLKHEHFHGDKKLKKTEIVWLIQCLEKHAPGRGMVSIEDRGPSSVAASLAITGYTVSQWCPTPDPKDSKPEQVHLQIDVAAIPFPLSLRFKAMRGVKLLVGTLLEHANDVWPDEADRNAVTDAVAAEREACAQIAERDDDYWIEEKATADCIAQEIRNRKS